MQKLMCENMKMEGLKVIYPFYLEDERGYFLKNYEKDVFMEFGVDISICEDFETYSRKNVIRGLHFQTKAPQGKLIRALKGKIRDVAVDLRKDSPTFAQWESIELSDENHLEFWIPKGFAHGFEVLSNDAIVSYKCEGRFLPAYDTGIYYNDDSIGINWETKNPVLSNKDKNLMNLNKFVETYGGL